VTFRDYQALRAVNWSTLKHARRSLLHYRHARDLVPPKEPTDAMALGTAAHLAMLEPHRLPLDLAVWSGGVRRGKEWEAFCQVNAGKTRVSAEQYEMALRMGEAVRSHPIAGPVVSGGGKAEVTVTWRDGASGLECKGRIDWQPADAVIVDLKTAREIGTRQFASAAWSMGYFHQLAFYRRGVALGLGCSRDAVTTRIVAVENTAPFDVVVFDPDGDSLGAADDEIDALLAKVAQAERTGQWPGAYATEPVRLFAPSWAFPYSEDDGYEIVRGDAQGG